MNVWPRIMIMGIIVSALLFGCYHLPDIPIQPESLILPENGRIMICEARSGVFTYEIRPFHEELDLKGLSVVGPPPEGLKGRDLDQLVKEMIQKGPPLNMVFVANPVKKVERYYNPHQVFKGWRERTIIDGYRDGTPVYRTVSEPVLYTEYKNQCTRTTYHLFQYDKDGRFMGRLHLTNPDFKGCPETSDEDIHFNEISSLIDWLRSHITIKMEKR